MADRSIRTDDGTNAVADVMLAAMEGSTNSLSCTAEDGSFDKQRISLSDLKQLKAVFDRAAEEGGGGELDEEQFLAAFSPILGAAMSEEQLRLWFMRVDASANGAVDWDEFSSFLLYSVDKGHSVVTSSGVSIDEVSFVKDPRTAIGNSTEASATRVSGYNHADAMTKVLIHPRGKIFTSGQDGTIRIWDGTTMDFEGMLHHGKGWVTDMAFARDYAKIVATTVDRLVLVYDVHTEKLSRGFAGTIDVAAIAQAAQQMASVEVPWLRPLKRFEIDRRHVASTASANESLSEYRARHERRREGRKAESMMKMIMLSKMEVPALCLAIIPASATVEGTEQVVVGLTDGSILAYALFGAVGVNEKVEPTMCFPELHAHAFVTCIKWVPAIASIITTGSDGHIHVISPIKKTQTRVCDRYADEHPIHACEWISSERLLATCGNDRYVSLWSLNSRGPPIPLKGHLAHVSHLHYREEDNLLFTMDVDKCIKVWDVRTLRPIQSMIDYDTYKPVDKQTVLTYDSKRHCLVTGIVAPVLWSMGRLLVPYPDPAYTGHQKAITAVLYSKVFHQIVTADSDQIKTWAVDTGELMSTVTVDSLRSTAVRSSLPTDVYGAIYAVTFDRPGRRLLVGVTGGRVLITNFANGQLLQELVPQLPHRDRRDFSSSECSAMAYYSTGAKCYIGCVRGNELLVWEDVAEGTLEKRLDRIVSLALTKRTFAHFAVIPPHSDVLNGVTRWRPPSPLCICAMPPGYVAVGTDCGLVVVYSSVSLDVLSVFGVYDLNINISALHYDERRELLFAAKSDATVDVLSQGMKDTRFNICLRDPRTGRAATATCIDLHEDTGLLVLGTDEGYALLFDTSEFAMADVPAGQMHSATIYHDAHGCCFIGGFQAHKDDLCRLQLFADRDLKMAPKKNDASGDADDLNATNRSLQSQPSLATSTLYLATGGSDCQTRLWVSTHEQILDKPQRNARPRPHGSGDGDTPPVIVTPSVSAGAGAAGSRADSKAAGMRSNSADGDPLQPLIPVVASSAASKTASPAGSPAMGPQESPFGPGPLEDTLVGRSSSSSISAPTAAPKPHPPPPRVQSVAAAPSHLPPLPFYDVRFVGYCGDATGWQLTETRGRIEALTSIPAPLTHETADYFAVAREVRDPPAWRQLPKKSDIVDAHLERGLLAMEEPETETARVKREALEGKRQRLERVIAAPNLYARARNRDKALLLQPELTPSSACVDRHAAPSAAPRQGSPTSTSTGATSRLGRGGGTVSAVQPSPAVGVGTLASGGHQGPRAPSRPANVATSPGRSGSSATAPRPHSPSARNKGRLDAAAAGGLLNKQALARTKRRKSMILLQGMMSSSAIGGVFDGSGSQQASPQSQPSPRTQPRFNDVVNAAISDPPTASPQQGPASPVTRGNQTPQLPALPAAATQAGLSRQQSVVAAAPGASRVPTLPKIDLVRAKELQQPTGAATAATAPTDAGGFLLAFPSSAKAPGVSPKTGDDGLTPRGRSPNREALVSMSRIATQQAAEDALVEEGAMKDPELDDEARMLARERCLPISARIDQWRRTQQARPQRAAGQAWTARPHGQLGLARMDGELVANATSGRRRQVMLMELDNRNRQRRGVGGTGGAHPGPGAI